MTVLVINSSKIYIAVDQRMEPAAPLSRSDGFPGVIPWYQIIEPCVRCRQRHHQDDGENDPHRHRHPHSFTHDTPPTLKPRIEGRDRSGVSGGALRPPGRTRYGPLRAKID